MTQLVHMTTEAMLVMQKHIESRDARIAELERQLAVARGEFRTIENHCEHDQVGGNLDLCDCSTRMSIIAGNALAVLSAPTADSVTVPVDEARAGGLEKAAEIARYHRDLPNRNAAGKAMATDIETSCLATAVRIRRGEYEDPSSSVMSSQPPKTADSAVVPVKDRFYWVDIIRAWKCGWAKEPDYAERAARIDANMMHSLAMKIADDLSHLPKTEQKGK